jgi:hypothetical protein
MKWSSVKSFYKNPYIKISTVILVGLPITLEILDLIHGPVKISLSIACVFFGSLILALAILFYYFYAPEEIRKYDDMDVYKRVKETDLLKKDISEREGTIIPNLSEGQESVGRELLQLKQDINNTSDPVLRQALIEKKDALVNRLYPPCVVRFLESKYHRLNTTHKPGMVNIIHIMLWVAGLLFGYVFVVRIYTVIKHL